MSEYVLMFFLAAGMVTAMTIYFKRAVQARMADARNSMINMVANRAGDYYDNGFLQREYEPYYSSADSMVMRYENAQINLLPGGSTGDLPQNDQRDDGGPDAKRNRAAAGRELKRDK